MKILFYNVAHCRGINGSLRQYFSRPWKYFVPGRFSAQPISDFTAQIQPDVACFVEIDKNHVQHFSRQNIFPSISSASRYPYLSPYRRVPVMRNHAYAVFSKDPHQLTSTYYFKRGLKKAVPVIKIGENLSLIVVHLALGYRTRRAQLKELATLVRSLPGKTVICGDFNILKFGVSELSGLIQSTGLIVTHQTSTYPSYKPQKALDLFLISPGLQVNSLEIPPVEHSDHLPVVIDLSVELTG